MLVVVVMTSLLLTLVVVVVVVVWRCRLRVVVDAVTSEVVSDSSARRDDVERLLPTDDQQPGRRHRQPPDDDDDDDDDNDDELQRAHDASSCSRLELDTTRHCVNGRPCPAETDEVYSERMLLSMRKGVPRISIGARPKGPKAERGVRVLGEGQQPPPHQLGIWGSAVSSAPAGSGRPDGPKVFHYFQHSGWPLLTL